MNAIVVTRASILAVLSLAITWSVAPTSAAFGASGSITMTSTTVTVKPASGGVAKTSRSTTTGGQAHIAAAKAKTLLAALASKLKDAREIIYTALVSTNTPGAEAASKYEVACLYAKPNLVRITAVLAHGSSYIVCSDGKNMYSYDVSSAKYIKRVAPASLLQAVQSIATDTITLQQPLLSTGLFLPVILLDQPDQLASVLDGAKSVTVADAMLNGAPANRIESVTGSGNGGLTADIYLRKSDNLLSRLQLTMTMTGKKPVDLLSVDFIDLELKSDVAAAAKFAFTPPATAAEVTPSATPSAPAERPLLASGAVAPDFAAETVSGGTVHLADYAGKVVVLDFWSTWCGPCQMSLPHTAKIAQAYQTKGVVFLPVCSWDDMSALKQWLPSHKSLGMTFYFDPAGKDGNSSIAGKLYNVDGIPTQYVIGKDGKVVTGFIGYDPSQDPNEKALTSAIDKALAASATVASAPPPPAASAPAPAVAIPPAGAPPTTSPSQPLSTTATPTGTSN